MKRVTIDSNLVKQALTSYLQTVNILAQGNTSNELGHVQYDLNILVGMFSGRYKITMEIEQEDIEMFGSRHYVDFPIHSNMEIVDIETVTTVTTTTTTVTQNI